MDYELDVKVKATPIKLVLEISSSKSMPLGYWYLLSEQIKNLMPGETTHHKARIYERIKEETQ